MRESEKTNNLLAALCAFQGELPTMPKDKKAFNYRYADLDTIVSKIKPILSKNGLGFMQPISTTENGSLIMTTRIFNKDGEYIETDVTLQNVDGKQMNNIQQMGAGVTYMRRYALCSLLGITSDEDADGEIRNYEQPKKEEIKKGESKAPQKAELKGGDATPDEKAELNKLFSAKYPDGKEIFTTEEKKKYSAMRKEKTAAEVIKLIDAETQKRVGAYIDQKENQ